MEIDTSVSAAQSRVEACLCIHCGTRAAEPGREFCCDGCEAVYSILHSRGLTEYYQLKKAGGFLRKALPAAELNQTYAYLSDPEFQKLYATRAEAGTPSQMMFFLEGVHCAACVWLLEKLPQFVEGVNTVHIDMSNSTASVKVEHPEAFAKAAREFHRLGYKPHPVRGAELDEHQKRENRLMLIRVGVAGACTGNIMLLAVSVYGGAPPSWASYFNWWSFAIFLPIVFFSAIPFYRDAWAALRLRTVSIDVPIVLGIFLGSIASFVNLVTSSGHIYFDSLAALTFLLLSSRYVLKRAQQSALQSSKLLHFLTPSVVYRKTADGTEEIGIDLVKSGDIIQVRAGDAIPIDGLVVQGRSRLNCALLTGESDLVDAVEGQTVFAGTVNHDSVLEIRVAASGYSTRLGQILKSIEEGTYRKAPIVSLADKVSRYFVTVVIALAAGVFAWGAYRAGWTEGLNRALAMVIITCPCALALATPLAMSVSIGKAARNGILIKGADVLERLTEIDTVYLDKTGTLTTGNFEVLAWETRAGSEDEATAAALALESRSNHPLAKAIVRKLRGRIPVNRLPDVADFRETIGKGVSGRIGEDHFELRQADRDSGTGARSAGTRITLYKNAAPIATAVLGDRVREDSLEAVSRLKRAGLDVFILSGDAEEPVAKVAEELDIPHDNTLSRATPERKHEIVREHPRALMVGDGANDAIALSSAYVGVAVHGGMEVSLRAADAYLSQPGVGSILNLIQIARETSKVLHRNLWFSLIYNAAGGGAALFGWVNPLFAAILMPASALTVFLSSMMGTRALSRLLDEMNPRETRK